METLSLLWGTCLLRPYVFGFLALYLIVALGQIGAARTLAWTITGYLIAFTAEYASIHWGIPFGDYFYVEATRGRELWVAGVPFMDSLSFTFLSFAGYSCAWQLARTRTPPGPQASDATRLRRTPRVLLVGALVTMLMDVVIDPVALLGGQWFLGEIYGYRHPGVYFGIPFSNFAGWFVVSLAIIGVNQLLDPLLPDPGQRPLTPARPWLHLGGFVLFLLVAGFNLAVALWLRAWGPLLSGLAVTAAFLAISWRRLSAAGMLVAEG